MKKWLLLLALLLPAGAVIAYGILFPKLSNCYTIAWSGDFKRTGDLFYPAALPEAELARLQQLLAAAEARNVAFWGAVASKPRIIYCDSDAVFGRYGSEHAPATTWIGPFGSVIVLAPGGLDPDIVSHERCHTEFAARLGWYRRETKIPTWFDEGLAMQLDYREAYVDPAIAALPDKPALLRPLTGPAEFWQGGDSLVRHHYLLAKYAVRDWMAGQDVEKVNRLIGAVRGGASFEAVFEK